MKRIERDPRITYYAVNRQGDLRTNTHSEGPNAVTWGVFPGKEIIQPTIVEAVSFIAWKDEAFELGVQWAGLYPDGSESRKLIQQVMDTSYLVNIVANDFKDGMSIFEPFQLEQADSLPPLPKSQVAAPATSATIAGVAQTIKESANAVKESAQSAIATVQDKVLGNGSAVLTATSGSSGETGRLATPPVNGGLAKENGTASSYDVDAPTKSDANGQESADVQTDEGGSAKVNGNANEEVNGTGRLATPPVNGTNDTGASTPAGDEASKEANTDMPDEMPAISESEISAAVESRMNDLLRPGPVPRKRYTPADLDTLFDDIPLFMRDNDKAATSENDTLEALKTLVFEGNGDEVAMNFKNHAVENHQQGKLREALAQYTQGLEAKPEDPKLVESLLLNRAACNLSLGESNVPIVSDRADDMYIGNNGSVLRDTSAILKLNPDSPKAYFRAATALLSLSRYEDALTCIDHGRKLESEQEDSKQATWQGLQDKAKKGLQAITEREERLRRDKLGKEALQQAIRVSAKIWVLDPTTDKVTGRSEASFKSRQLLHPTIPIPLGSPLIRFPTCP